MNAVSLLLRLIAILGALAAGGLFYLDKTELKDAQDKAATEVKTATANAAKAKADADTATEKATAADEAAKDATNKLTKAQGDLDAATKAAATQKTEVAALNTKLDAATKKANAADDLRLQVTRLETSNDALKKQVADQAVLTAANNPPKTSSTGGLTNPIPTPGPSDTTSGGNTPPASTAGPVTPTKILEINAKAGILTLAAGSNAGIEKGSELILQSSGVKLVSVRVNSSQPDFSVATITNSTISAQEVAKLLKANTALDYVKTR